MERVLGDLRRGYTDTLLHQSYSCRRRLDLHWRHTARLQHAKLQQQRKSVRQYARATGGRVMPLLLLHRRILLCHSRGLRARQFLRWRELRVAVPHDFFDVPRFIICQRNSPRDL
jgi:hypothetical protein